MIYICISVTEIFSDVEMMQFLNDWRRGGI